MHAVSEPRAPAAEAFTDLFDRHWPAVYAYALRRTARAADAHDIAAETFTTAWRRFDDLPEGHELPWLYRTAANVLANHRRGGARAERLTLRAASQPASAPDDPADVAIDDVVLKAAFAALDPSDREVLTLVAWEGLSNPELAVALDISVNAAALRVSRARSRLEEAIAAAEATPPPTTSPTTSDASGHERDDDRRTTVEGER